MAEQIATLAGGCFWCTEAVFQRLRGGNKVLPGYTAGSVANPTYEQVSAGTSGHTEAIQVSFNPEVISYRDLLEVFFQLHDPTTLNRQGYDVGTQYRSGIYYADETQKTVAEEVKQEVDASSLYSDPVVTEIEPLGNFYAAEDFHLDFYDSNRQYPYCQAVIDPKIQKLFKDFGEKLAKVAEA